jgi:hypothetical protein
LYIPHWRDLPIKEQLLFWKHNTIKMTLEDSARRRIPWVATGTGEDGASGYRQAALTAAACDRVMV